MTEQSLKEALYAYCEDYPGRSAHALILGGLKAPPFNWSTPSQFEDLDEDAQRVYDSFKAGTANPWDAFFELRCDYGMVSEAEIEEYEQEQREQKDLPINKDTGGH